MEELSGFPRHLLENDLIDYVKMENYKKYNNENAFNLMAKDKLLLDKELAFQAFLFTNESLLDLTYFNINEIELEQDLEFDKKNLILPVKMIDKKLVIMVFNPFNKAKISEKLQKKYPHDSLKIFIVAKKNLINFIEKVDVYFQNKDLNIKTTEKKEIKKEEIMEKPSDKIEEKKEQGSLNEEENIKDQTIKNFLKLVLTSSINSNADEIHFEPYNNSYRVRFKQNNELNEVFSQPKEIGEDVSNKIKEMANLDLTSRKPQFGNLTLKINSSKSVDFKVSVCPLYFGEKIVFNVKHNDAANLNFDYIGLETEDVIKLNKSLQTQDGVFIFNGKKQSGRKYSMYTVLKSLNSKKMNIYTIENNVGFYLDGINQLKITQDFSYSDALEIVSSQNADVIMIDVIEDVNILKKLFQLAKTGRMILLKMNLRNNKEVMQYLIRSDISLLDIYMSLKVIISQELLKELCQNCKDSDMNVSVPMLKEMGFNEVEIEDYKTLWDSKISNGCLECEGSGHNGIIAIFDLFIISKDMRQLILNGQFKTFVDMIENIKEDILFEKAKIKFKEGLIDFEQLKLLHY